MSMNWQEQNMLKGLFLNSPEAHCSIHESGKMIYNALKLSDKYTLDYIEIDANNRTIPDTYDFLAFNYHPYVMGWLNTATVKNLPGLKITFVLEALPNNPFPMCPPNDFDIYCVLDPTMNIPDHRVHAFPRPLEPSRVKSFVDPDIPTIGTFGFATPGKGFELVVSAVNKEFDKAIVRINIPIATHIGTKQAGYAEYLADICYKTAKEGIDVRITHNYMTKQQLIYWCSKNTLNCFLYNRNQPGLSATTDQAISSGRPLAVSTNETFRHILQYIKPYPERSLKESIACSIPEVLAMQENWNPVNFAWKFEQILVSQNACPTSRISVPLTLGKKGLIQAACDAAIQKAIYTRGVEKLARKLFFYHGTPMDTTIPKKFPGRTNILFISQKERQCGIYQYGRNITNTLRKSKKYNFIFCECGNRRDLNRVIHYHEPAAVIYNYHFYNMPWLASGITRAYTMPQIELAHEFTQETANTANNEMFDYHLYQDPDLIERNLISFRTKQLVYPYTNTVPLPEIPTIGSFGFGTPGKGFDRLVEQVQKEFDVANIRINLPFNDVVDKDGKAFALPTAKACRENLYKPGITLTITHEFFTEPQLLDFLAGNSLNAFLYNPAMNLGISGPGLHALAVHRPMAITRCGMFRHLLKASPSICIEDSSLKEIIANGLTPLEPFYEAWSEEAFIADYERILDMVLE